MHNYRTWLNEVDTSSRSAPDSIEMRIGNVKTPIGPKSDNWIKELVRLKEYLKISAQIQNAIDDNDDSSLKDILDCIKDMPLFKGEQDGEWQKLQINGAENRDSNEEMRRQVCRYIINKIAELNAWHEKT